MATSTAHEKRDDQDGHGKDTITVIVSAPRTPQPKTFHWPKTLKVGEAAKLAADAFGYKGGSPGLQTEKKPQRVLDNNKTLEEEGVRNGDKLEIVDTGGGV